MRIERTFGAALFKSRRSRTRLPPRYDGAHRLLRSDDQLDCSGVPNAVRAVHVLENPDDGIRRETPLQQQQRMLQIVMMLLALPERVCHCASTEEASASQRIARSLNIAVQLVVG